MHRFIVLAALAVVASAHHEDEDPYYYPRPQNSPLVTPEKYTLADDPHGFQAVPLKAIVRIANPAGSEIQGNVTFTQVADKVHVVGSLYGLPKGQYGFHVHEKGDITGGCGSTGPHFNPDHKDHGSPKDENRHVGDLGNVEFDDNKVAHIDFNDSRIALIGPHGILGRAVVLHERIDDFGKTSHPDSRTTGNAGGRVACGVIGILDPVYAKWTSSASSPAPTISALLVASVTFLFFNKLFSKF